MLLFLILLVNISNRSITTGNLRIRMITVFLFCDGVFRYHFFFHLLCYCYCCCHITSLADNSFHSSVSTFCTCSAISATWFWKFISSFWIEYVTALLSDAFFLFHSPTIEINQLKSISMQFLKLNDEIYMKISEYVNWMPKEINLRYSVRL